MDMDTVMDLDTDFSGILLNILIIIGVVICLIASAKVRTTFNKYSTVRSMSGLTGAQAAERILSYAGIHNVQVRHISGNLNDHYDPRNRTLSPV